MILEKILYLYQSIGVITVEPLGACNIKRCSKSVHNNITIYLLWKVFIIFVRKFLFYKNKVNHSRLHLFIFKDDPNNWLILWFINLNTLVILYKKHTFNTYEKDKIIVY